VALPGRVLGRVVASIGARWYDSSTGTFISLDPVLETSSEGQLNGYTYAAANPVDGSDPTGDSLVGCGSGCGIITNCTPPPSKPVPLGPPSELRPPTCLAQCSGGTASDGEGAGGSGGGGQAYKPPAGRARECGALIADHNDPSGAWLSDDVPWYGHDVDLASIRSPAGWGMTLSDAQLETFGKNLRERGSGPSTASDKWDPRKRS